MLYKNANCCNIKKILKYGTVFYTFSGHITIFKHFQLIFDISNVNNDKHIKEQMENFILQTFQNYYIFLPHPSKESHFGIKSCAY